MNEYIETEPKTLKQIFDENNIQECNLLILKMGCEGCEFDIIFTTPKEYLGRIQKVTSKREFHGRKIQR